VQNNLNTDNTLLSFGLSQENNKMNNGSSWNPNAQTRSNPIPKALSVLIFAAV
jgi:hypothetical protein